ncbi:C-type lectin domain family 2 member B-like [Genypterus blacodes]|uniref:C-type lectin domain family 2 member B-like n=1 Tax=Genypterus blacodes TaxID=154954 RepID=UPI003F75B83C
MISQIYEDVSDYREAGADQGGERVEQLVEIYKSIDYDRSHNDLPRSQETGARNKPPASRAFLAALALLCLLLLVVIIVGFYQLSITNEKLHTLISNLTNQNLIRTPPCAEGWSLFQQHCYYKSTEGKNWTASREECSRRKADLVIISSKEEQKFVRKLNGAGDSWIGLQRPRGKKTSQKDSWRWVDESHLMLTFWRVDEDINSKIKRLVHINSNGTWTPSEDGPKQWICEGVQEANM